MDVEYQIQIPPLIKSRNWKKVHRTLVTNSSVAKRLLREVDTMGLSCLELALGHQAPVEIIRVMLENIELSRFHHSHDAHCLHIACLNGAPLDSIDLLLSKVDTLITYPDADLRVPLHHAVEFACINTDEANDRYSYELMHIIYRAKPKMIFAADRFGDSPIDLVHIMQLKSKDQNTSEYKKLEKIQNVLRSFATAEYRKRKLQWENESFHAVDILNEVIDDDFSRAIGRNYNSLESSNYSEETNRMYVSIGTNDKIVQGSDK